MPATILALMIMFLFTFNYEKDVHWPPFFLLMSIGLGFIIYKLIEKNRLTMIQSCFAVYVLGSGIVLMAWRPLVMGLANGNMTIVLNLVSVSSEALIQLLIIGSLFLVFWKQTRRPIAEGLFWGGLLHSLFLIYDQLLMNRESGVESIGLLGNRSIGASMTCVWMFFSLHFVCHRFKSKACTYGILGVGTLAVLVSQSGISYAALIAGAMAWAFIEYRWRSLLFSVPLLSIGAILAPIVKPQFYDSHTTRYELWKQIMPMWWESNTLFGWGLGTYKFYGPNIQVKNHFMEGVWFLWLHNDWAQILVELGFIGLALTLAVYAECLYKARDRSFLFAALIAAGVIGLGNYMLHIAVTSLIVWWLVFETKSFESENV